MFLHTSMYIFNENPGSNILKSFINGWPVQGRKYMTLLFYPAEITSRIPSPFYDNDKIPKRAQLSGTRYDSKLQLMPQS